MVVLFVGSHQICQNPVRALTWCKQLMHAFSAQFVISKRILVCTMENVLRTIVLRSFLGVSMISAMLQSAIVLAEVLALCAKNRH